MENERVDDLRKKSLRLNELKKSKDVIEFLTILKELGLIFSDRADQHNLIDISNRMSEMPHQFIS